MPNLKKHVLKVNPVLKVFSQTNKKRRKVRWICQLGKIISSRTLLLDLIALIGFITAAIRGISWMQGSVC